jgi:hypothetical protein
MRSAIEPKSANMPRKFSSSLYHTPRTVFVERIKLLPHVPRRLDVLFPEQAWTVAYRVLLNAVIEEHNRQTSQHIVLDPDGAECRQWDRLGIVDRVMHEIRAAGSQCDCRDVVGRIVFLNLRNSRNSFMLDTDEIRTLAGVTYGVGVSVRRDYAHIAARWACETVQQEVNDDAGTP